MSGIAFKTLGGEGQDIVLIHGFGSDRLSWLGNSPALLPLARVHALDLPGHGESSVDVGDGTPATLASRVRDCLDAQGLGRVHIVAHSLGGGIAMLLAAEDPQRVASLSLIAPAGLGTGVNRDFLSTYPALTDAESTAIQLRRLVTRPILINKMTVQRVLDQLNREGARDALRLIATQLVAHEGGIATASLEVAKLGIPRLALWGGSDAINPPDANRIAAFGGTNAMIAGAGHLPHIEAAKAVNTALVEFLQGLLAD